MCTRIPKELKVQMGPSNTCACWRLLMANTCHLANVQNPNLNFTLVAYRSLSGVAAAACASECFGVSRNGAICTFNSLGSCVHMAMKNNHAKKLFPNLSWRKFDYFLAAALPAKWFQDSVALYKPGFCRDMLLFLRAAIGYIPREIPKPSDEKAAAALPERLRDVTNVKLRYGFCTFCRGEGR